MKIHVFLEDFEHRSLFLCFQLLFQKFCAALGDALGPYNHIVSYFFNVDFGRIFWQILGSRDMLIAARGDGLHFFQNETPNFRGR